MNSTLQKNLLTQSTFERNTRYHDIPSIISQQNECSIKGRKPIKSLSNNEKLQSSFTNSTTVLTTKLDDDLYRYKNRLSLTQNKSDYEREYSFAGSPKLKGFSIERMTNREYHQKLKNKLIQDERLFNNFKIEKPDLSHTCNFAKKRARKVDFQLKHINDLYHESQKPYERFYYSSNTMKQKVNYKLQNKSQKRYFFKSKRAEDVPATNINPEKVDQGLKVASNFKGSNLKRTGMASFHLQTGREYPSSLDLRYDNSLTSFRKDGQGKIMHPNLDFAIRRLKESLISHRKQAIRRSKKPQFTRDQLCDLKYFNAHEKQKANYQ